MYKEQSTYYKVQSTEYNLTSAKISCNFSTVSQAYESMSIWLKIEKKSQVQNQNQNGWP